VFWPLGIADILDRFLAIEFDKIKERLMTLLASSYRN
jgi:hypothetical protein